MVLQGINNRVIYIQGYLKQEPTSPRKVRNDEFGLTPTSVMETNAGQRNSNKRKIKYGLIYNFLKVLLFDSYRKLRSLHFINS